MRESDSCRFGRAEDEFAITRKLELLSAEVATCSNNDQHKGGEKHTIDVCLERDIGSEIGNADVVFGKREKATLPAIGAMSDVALVTFAYFSAFMKLVFFPAQINVSIGGGLRSAQDTASTTASTPNAFIAMLLLNGVVNCFTVADVRRLASADLVNAAEKKKEVNL